MKNYILLFLGGLALTSCVKHEVIPAPTPPVPTVTYDCSFIGEVDGTSKSLIAGQNGFYCNENKVIATVTQQPTTGIWFSEILHPSSAEKAKLSHGQMSWPETDNLPSTLDWRTFYLNNPSPLIADDAIGGVEFSYTDNTGTEFTTQDTSVYNSTINYTFLEADSASNGLFIKYTATINCKVYSEAGASKIISGATMKGAYKYN